MEFLNDLLGISLLASTSVLPHDGQLGLLANAALMPICNMNFLDGFKRREMMSNALNNLSQMAQKKKKNKRGTVNKA
jgi:hypothetical protein